MEGITSKIHLNTASQIIVQANLHSVPLFFLALDGIFNSFCFHIRHTVFLLIFCVGYLIINMGIFSIIKPIL